MSGFDIKFLKVYEDGCYEKAYIPTIWNTISSTTLFRTKLAATAELGVTLCSSGFSWEMWADDLKDLGIQKLDIASFLEPFAEESPDFDTLLTSAQNLKALFNFKLPLIDVIGLIRSCVFRVPITSYREPSELFQSTCYAKSFLQTLSAFPMFYIAIKECKNITFGSFKGEFTPLVKSSTRLNGFGGFWSEYKPSETTETNKEQIEVVTGSKYFLLSFIEENKPNEDNESGHPDFLKVITQMRLILSQTARGSVVSKIRNFHNLTCCHAILSSRDQVVILTMKPSLSKTDDNNISIDYLLYLSGIYNMKEKNDRLTLCNFLITSAYIASSITKLICANLLSEIESCQSTFSSPQKSSPKRRLQIGNLLYCKNQNNRFAIQIEKEIANGGDKPLYEGTIVGTEDKCIIKIYNNNRDSGYKLWHLRLQYTDLTGYNEDTHFDIPYSDISYKGTPLEVYLDTNKDVNKTTLMIKLLVQLHDLHQMEEILHNDIKPENIIVYQDYPYFIDFEACKKYARYDEEKEICFDSDNRAIQSSSGTRTFNPPEKYQSTNNHITPKSDIYSLGLVFAKLLNSSQTKDIKSNFERLKETNDETVCNLIEKMISNDIKTRPSTQQCLDILGVSQYENFSTPIIEKQLPNLNPPNFKQLLESKKRERTGTNLQEREQKKVKNY